jgi:hypothetical protein
MLLGLQRVALHTRFETSRSRCHMSFRYEGRIATVSSREPCDGPASLAAFGAGIETLGRLSRDARAEPDAAARRQRVQAAISRCDAAAAAFRALDHRQPMQQAHLMERLDASCDYAMRLAAQGLATEPLEASRAVVHAGQVKAATQGSARLDYSQEVLAALERAGQARSADAVRAHLLRALWLNRRGRSEESRASLYALLPVAPEVLRWDDPAHELIWQAAHALPEAEKHRYVTLAGTRHAQALAQSPGSPLEVRIRYDLCATRMSWNIEREKLKECADAVVASWAATGSAPRPAPEAARMLGFMYVTYAYASRDFAAGEAGVGQVLRHAEAHMPATPENEPVFKELREAQLTLRGKAVIAPTGR